MYYRVLISSQNALNGGANNNGTYQIFAPIQLPTTKKYQYAIESFVCANTTIAYPTFINIPSLTQLDSYSTLNQGSSSTCLIIGTDAFYQTINSNTIGMPLTNIDWLTSGRLQINFVNDEGALVAMNDWALVLVIYPVKGIK